MCQKVPTVGLDRGQSCIGAASAVDHNLREHSALQVYGARKFCEKSACTACCGHIVVSSYNHNR